MTITVENLRAIANDSENTTDRRLVSCTTDGQSLRVLASEIKMLWTVLRGLADDLADGELAELNAQAERDLQQHEARQRLADAVLAVADSTDAEAASLALPWPVVPIHTLADYVRAARVDNAAGIYRHGGIVADDEPSAFQLWLVKQTGVDVVRQNEMSNAEWVAAFGAVSRIYHPGDVSGSDEDRAMAHDFTAADQ